tara:strand:+ start:41 stop:481 length:441 start_codon:yes stop_codon:yes gene_type:complete
MKKILIALLALVIINCGGGESQEAQVVTISSLGAEMKFDVEEFTVKAGSKVKIIMKNNTPIDFLGEMQHNVVIFKDESAAPMIISLAEGNGGEPYPDGRILAMTALADKQEETFVEFTAPKKPGKYLYVCTYIAHAMSMRGYMIVE